MPQPPLSQLAPTRIASPKKEYFLFHHQYLVSGEHLGTAGGEQGCLYLYSGSVLPFLHFLLGSFKFSHRSTHRHIVYAKMLADLGHWICPGAIRLGHGLLSIPSTLLIVRSGTQGRNVRTDPASCMKIHWLCSSQTC